MFALSHHIIVRVAAILAGKTDYDRYALLGDDLVIADKDVADKYIEIVNSLGVQISEHKTHRGSILCDFAKRT